MGHSPAISSSLISTSPRRTFPPAPGSPWVSAIVGSDRGSAPWLQEICRPVRDGSDEVRELPAWEEALPSGHQREGRSVRPCQYRGHDSKGVAEFSPDLRSGNSRDGSHGSGETLAANERVVAVRHRNHAAYEHFLHALCSARTERARERADRRPSSPRRAWRAQRMEHRALRAVARAARARDLAAGLDGETTAR